MNKLLFLLFTTLCLADMPLVKEIPEGRINYRIVADDKTIVWSSRIKLVAIGNQSLNFIYAIKEHLSFDEYIKTDQSYRLLYYYKF
jgi:hypothetical protein